MRKAILSPFFLAIFTPILHAGTAANVVDLPGIVITATATRSETPQNELASSATVYTRQDIENSQVRTLPDLLKGTIGLDIAQTGGYGQPTSLFLRGTETDQVLVLIDGIKVGSATVGTSPFELLPIDQIERVEIIRGPQSSLYGSEAIGGVIQIFTRKGSIESKPKFSLEAGGGSYDTAHTAGTVSGSVGNNWYNLGISHLNSEGFTATTNSDPDRDGYENTGINARIGHHFDNDAEVEAFFMRSEGVNEYDNDPVFGGGDNSEFVNQVVGLSGNMKVMDNWRSTLQLGQSLDELDTFLHDHTFENRFNTTRWNVSWLNQVQISDVHQVTLGTDYRVDEIDSSDLDIFNTGFDTYNERSRYDVGIFGELHSRLLDHHFVNASVRWDENQAFGDFVTGNIGWRYNSVLGISPFASFGNAFKAPTFNELYFPDTGFGGGNPNLKPEKSASFEVGLAGSHRIWQWELRAYHTDAEDLIVGFPPVNAAKARIEGIEAQISTDWLGWHQKLGLGIMEPIDLATGKRLQRRADKSLSYDLSRSIGAFDLGVNVLAQGDRPDVDFSTYPFQQIRLAGYVTVDLRAAYHIDKNWLLSAKLNNLLDESYQTVFPYNTADRNFFISIGYNN